jgi:hypothetical protein
VYRVTSYVLCTGLHSDGVHVRRLLLSSCCSVRPNALMVPELVMTPAAVLPATAHGAVRCALCAVRWRAARPRLMQLCSPRRAPQRRPSRRASSRRSSRRPPHRWSRCPPCCPSLSSPRCCSSLAAAQSGQVMQHKPVADGPGLQAVGGSAAAAAASTQTATAVLMAVPRRRARHRRLLQLSALRLLGRPSCSRCNVAGKC